VLSRHAGPGDTILLINRLARGCRRRPSVVLRASVALDPAIDLLTSRLPHAVIDSADGEDSEQAIENLARGLGPGGALLLYPEGGNFTVERRRSALAHLRRAGRARAASAASRMAHVLPPRPTGVHAALRGRPDAAVLFVAHTGLGLAAYPRQIYNELPIGGTLRTRWWRVDRDEIPATEEGVSAWLNRRWEEIDAWIDAQRTEAS
jgi:1-acyl-sn-glycerol-3-phosphate acyltransferase